MKTCRVCQSTDIYPAIDLGHHPLADRFLSVEQQKAPETFYPLSVSACRKCSYAGLDYIVPPQTRYADGDYSYTAGNSRVSREHFGELAAEILARVNYTRSGLVVDIGGNDGTLLAAIRARSPSTGLLNVDAAPYAAELSRKANIPTVEATWGTSDPTTPLGLGAAAIVCTNVLNHADDPRDFVHVAAVNLRPGGMLVIEVPSLRRLFDQGAWDTIYLEHVSYFGEQALHTLCNEAGLDVVRLETIDYMGGSTRVWAQKATTPFQHFHTDVPFRTSWKWLQLRARSERNDLTEQVWNAQKRGGGGIWALGAAAKGNTLLNYCRFDDTWIVAIADSSPHKIGKCAPGSRLQIVEDADVIEGAYALILPWNIGLLIREKFKDRNLQYLRYRGGADENT